MVLRHPDYPVGPIDLSTRPMRFDRCRHNRIQQQPVSLIDACHPTVWIIAFHEPLHKVPQAQPDFHAHLSGQVEHGSIQRYTINIGTVQGGQGLGKFLAG